MAKYRPQENISMREKGSLWYTAPIILDNKTLLKTKWKIALCIIIPTICIIPAFITAARIAPNPSFYIPALVWLGFPGGVIGMFAYSVYVEYKAKLEMHEVALRESKGKYPLLTCTGERLKDYRGTYFVAGCRIRSGWVEGVVLGISQQPPQDAMTSNKIRAWKLDCKTDKGEIKQVYVETSYVISGGMTEAEWQEAKRSIYELTLGGKPI